MPPRKRKPISPPQDTDAELDAMLEESVPDVIDPGYDGHKLRIAGKSWQEIAEQLGSPNTRSAMQSVSKYLQKAAASQSAMQLQEALQLQLDRYDVLLEHWWGPATTGHDEKAAMIVLRVMERIEKLHRLDDGEVVVAKETIVVAADPASYVAQLKGIVEQRALEKAGGK